MTPLATARQLTKFSNTIANDFKKQPADTFKRIEDKFLIRKSSADMVTGLVNRYLAPSYLEPDTHYTLIESIYFDSSEFDFFQHHFKKGLERRFKLRVRRYAPNGIWSQGPAYLEAKCKSKGFSTKNRFRISEAALNDLMTGKEIPIGEDLKKLNKGLKLVELAERVNFVNALISVYSLKAMISVRYQRLAFERDDVRVTIDRDINVNQLTPVELKSAEFVTQDPIWKKAFKMKNKFSNSENLVMEIKHAGQIPNWFLDLAKKLDVDKTGFSKYCWSMSKFIDSSMQNRID